MTSLLWKHTFGCKKKSDVSENIYIHLKGTSRIKRFEKKYSLFDFLDLVLYHFSSIFFYLRLFQVRTCVPCVQVATHLLGHPISCQRNDILDVL